MIRFAWQDEVLMKLLGVEIHTKNEILALFDEPEVIPNDTIMIDDGVHYAIKKDSRDKGQRSLCGCMASKDIGQYGTCLKIGVSHPYRPLWQLPPANSGHSSRPLGRMRPSCRRPLHQVADAGTER